MKLKSQTENIRIDKYLSQKTDFSRAKILKMLKDNHIKVNDKVIKPSYKVKLADEIEILTENLEENIACKNIMLDIIYEDDYLMVINKPSGIIVHPGSGNKNNTLVNGLLYYNKNLAKVGDISRPGIVHRLDKDTSGLLLIAKTNKAYQKLCCDFKNHQVVREYTALLEGNLPNNIKIDAPIGTDKKNFQKRIVTSRGKEAITYLTIIKKYQHFTLVKARLETGRTHQIRVHASHLGYPIYNDPLYSKNKNTTSFGQFLHASYLEFNHPISQEKMVFKLELPKEFQNFITNLEQNEN